MGSIVGGVSLALLLPKFGYPAIMGMAIGTLIGGFLQFAGQLPTLFKTGFALRPKINLKDPGLRRILRLMVPAVIGLSATQINIFINTRFASSCVEGSVSWLNYAFRLVQLPIGVFGVAISIATLPVISRYAAVKDIGKLKETFSSSLTMAFCLTIPASVGLWLLAEPIIALIFQHGVFTGFDTVKTAEALRFYAIGLFAYSSVKIMVPVFFALDDSRLPVIASFLAVGANLLFVSLFIDHFQHQAIAMATSCSMIFNFLFLGFALYRKVDGYSLSYIGISLCKVFCGAALMGVWVTVLQSWLAVLLAKGIIFQLFGLVIIIGSAALFYGAVLYALKVKELAFVADKIKTRIAG
jgi:putative peptidoglycan lipid II flippase